MSTATPEIRPATEADLASVTGIYDHAVRFGTATFELVPPDLGEMTQRFRALTDGGFPYLVAELDGLVIGYASAGGDVAERAAITGALSLYLNFINLFTLLLQLLGQRD